MCKLPLHVTSPTLQGFLLLPVPAAVGHGQVAMHLLLPLLNRQTLPRLLLLTCWPHSWPSPAMGPVCPC